MKYICCALLACAPIAHAEPEVVVRIENQAVMLASELHRAEEQAAAILAQAGVMLRVVNVRHPLRARSVNQECPAVDRFGTVDVLITEAEPPENSPNALAYAMPYRTSGLRVVIFYSRVKRLFRQFPAGSAQILGHVLAHEVSHVLMAFEDHSRGGLMQAVWTTADYLRMLDGPLPYTGDEARTIFRHVSGEGIFCRHDGLVAALHADQ
jgi:hypothetical protein